MVRDLDWPTIKKVTPQLFKRFIAVSTGFNKPRPTKRAIFLRPYQVERGFQIIDHTLRRTGAEKYGIISRKGGKTEYVADAYYFLACLPAFYEPLMGSGLKMGIFGPKREQADYTFDRFKERIDDGFAGRVLDIHETSRSGTKMTFDNNTYVRSLSASKTAHIECETFDVVVIEEAQDVADIRLTKSIFPMTAATNGPRFLIGTCTPEHRGYFYQKVRNRQKSYIYWWEVAKYSKWYKKFVEQERKRLGENSDAFQTQYCLKWLTEAVTFTTEDELDAMRKGVLVKSCKHLACYVGIDPAKQLDSTVVTVLDENGRILAWLERHGDNYVEQVLDIKAFLQPYNVALVFVGALGPGEPILDMMASPEVGRIAYPAQPFYDTRPGRDKMYKQLRKDMDAEVITYPDVECPERYRFEEQMLDAEKKYAGAMMNICHPKGRNRHDDYPDSLAFSNMARVQSSMMLDISIIKEGGQVITYEA